MLHKIWETLKYPFGYFVEADERLYWGYLLWCIALAVFVYWAEDKSSRGKLLAFLFPAHIYRTRGALVDLGFAYTVRIIYLFTITPLFLAMFALGSKWTVLSGNALFDRPAPWTGNLTPLRWAYALCFFVVLDFSVFFSHWLQHKLPWLWEFHKVHHSAKTLTPVTVFRMHPIDYVLNLGLNGFLVGIVNGVFLFCFQKAEAVRLAGLNVFLFIFYVSGFNLRHSHVWLSFGRHLSHVFVSPAMHQVHHSSETQHADKNLGFFLAIWDKLFGTLYVPKSKEAFQLGLSDGTTEEYQSVLRMYLLPFKKLFNLVGGRPGVSGTDPART